MSENKLKKWLLMLPGSVFASWLLVTLAWQDINYSPERWVDKPVTNPIVFNALIVLAVVNIVGLALLYPWLTSEKMKFVGKRYLKAVVVLILLIIASQIWFGFPMIKGHY